MADSKVARKPSHVSEISNTQKPQFCKQPFEIIQGQIAFKNTVQCVNKQTVILFLHPVF